MVVEPGEQRAEHTGRHAGVGLARTRRSGQTLLDLVAEEHAGGHGVGEPEGLPDVAAAHVGDRSGRGLGDVELDGGVYKYSL